MKKLTSLIIPTLLLFSCGSEETKSDLETLQNEKTQVLSKIDSLTAVLKTLDKKIAKLDNSANSQIVTITPLKNEDFTHFIEIQGVVKADKNIEIRPEMGGTVKAIYVKEGQRVSAGQVLVQLDDASIQSNLNELKAQVNLAKTTFERQERLWNQKIGSEIQYLQAKTQKESLESSLASLKSQARKMKIIAPFSGVVDEIFPKKGELTSPQLPVVRLVNLDNVHIEADVTEAYLPIVKVGTETEVFFPSLQKTITSKITHVGNFINPDNRSFKIRISIPNKEKNLKPNLLADVKIVDFKSNGIAIPSSLIQQDQSGKNYVFTVNTSNNESVVEKRFVTVGLEYNATTFIKEGLSETDTLVNKGARIVKDKETVQVSNK